MGNYHLIVSREASFKMPQEPLQRDLSKYRSHQNAGNMSIFFYRFEICYVAVYQRFQDARHVAKWYEKQKTKKTLEVLNPRSCEPFPWDFTAQELFKISKFYKNYISLCVDKICCMELQTCLLKFHSKYRILTLEDVCIFYRNKMRALQFIMIEKCAWLSGSQHSLHLRHSDHDGVANHQPHGCLFNRLFRRRSKKTLKLCGTGLCAGNSPGTAQMASNTENVSIWWRHYVVLGNEQLIPHNFNEWWLNSLTHTCISSTNLVSMPSRRKIDVRASTDGGENCKIVWSMNVHMYSGAQYRPHNLISIYIPLYLHRYICCLFL